MAAKDAPDSLANIAPIDKRWLTASMEAGPDKTQNFKRARPVFLPAAHA
jgi:hypothetical protein